jgi:hypothetical protein
MCQSVLVISYVILQEASGCVGRNKSKTSSGSSGLSCHVRSQVTWRNWRNCGKYNSLRFVWFTSNFVHLPPLKPPRKQGMSHISLSSIFYVKILSRKSLTRSNWKSTPQYNFCGRPCQETANPTVMVIQQWSKQRFHPHHPGVSPTPPQWIFFFFANLLGKC